jgi:transposase
MVREFVYVFAAVCAKLGRLTALILPRANTEMMNLFLEQLAQDFQGYFIILLVDQAGWHRAKGLQVPENIRLLPQPAYSPELNPAEHLWEELREKALPNCSFPSLDLLIDQLCEGLKELATDEQRVRSMVDFPYMRINTS